MEVPSSGLHSLRAKGSRGLVDVFCQVASSLRELPLSQGKEAEVAVELGLYAGVRGRRGEDHPLRLGEVLLSLMELTSP